MSMTKKRKANPNLDSYEQDIEDNLQKSKPLTRDEKSREINKLTSGRLVSKEHNK